MPSTPDDLREQLQLYGARPEEVVLLDEKVVAQEGGQGLSPAQYYRYLDLIRRPASEPGALRPRAIVEVAHQPVLYVVDRLEPLQPVAGSALVRLRRSLAFRAGADHVALVEPGKLTVYPVAPSEVTPEPREHLAARGGEAVISALALSPGQYGAEQTPASAAVHGLLYRLLTRTTAEVRATGVDKLDALSLVGRALFLRFLVDRGILQEQHLRRVCPQARHFTQCFESASHAAATSSWLDTTFNGDFLPLPEGGAEAWFRDLTPEVFRQLSLILHRAEASGQLHLRWGDNWNDLLFDRIPVGLLSQVYENFAHSDDLKAARAGSVYYTPRLIAEYMVDEVFSALGERAHEARVLDPAVGGGVFLVAAFRRLAAERWWATGKAPDTRELRDILERQLTGLDINEDALRLCSLGLYLTAMELDPSPQLGRLRFKRLMGQVLRNVAEPHSPRLGSLGAHVGPEFHGGYDVVIGNPPWTSWERGKLSKEEFAAQVRQVEEVIRPIIRKRLGEDEAENYTMVDKDPDLPFFWRAMEWAREGGWIALATHGRLLFRQSPQGQRAREQLFRAMRVVGVLNGAAMHETDVWPKTKMPFCLVFARNTPPSENDAFYFVSPEREDELNRRGRMRVDSTAAEPVALSTLLRRPTLLKTLYRGSYLDVGVLERIEAAAPRSLADYWQERWGQERSGQGFQVEGDANPVGDMSRLPMLARELEPPYRLTPYLVDARRLPRLPYKALHRPRQPSIYEAPLVLIGKRPAVERSREDSSAYLALESVCYNESFTGFSCAGHEEPELLARYLFLLLNSRIPLYIFLLTSSQYAVERRASLVQDPGRLPFRPLEELPAALRKPIVSLSEALIQDPEGTFVELDAWACRVYGLDRWDQEVMRDTLEVSLPYEKYWTRAQARPDSRELESFVKRVRDVIQPFVAPYQRQVSVRVLRSRQEEPWVVLQVDSMPAGEPLPALLEDVALPTLLAEADSLAVTQVIAVRPPRTLLVGLVAQYRYFTPSRARLLGLGLVQDHDKALLGEVAA